MFEGESLPLNIHYELEYLNVLVWIPLCKVQQCHVSVGNSLQGFTSPPRQKVALQSCLFAKEWMQLKQPWVPFNWESHRIQKFAREKDGRIDRDLVECS